MTNNITDFNEICFRYARALISSSKDEKELKKNKSFFDSLISLVDESEDFKKFVYNPLISSHKKLLILDQILGKLSFEKKFSNFIKVITKHNRLFTIHKIHSLFTSLIEEKENIVKISVITTKPMNKNLSETLKEKFEKVTKKKVDINNLVDADILGGVIIKFNSVMIDASVRTKLEKFQYSMKG